MKPRHLHSVPSSRPLEKLTIAERRIKSIEPRDFRSNPWMIGEGPRFWTPDRVAKLAADNEVLRQARKARP